MVDANAVLDSVLQAYLGSSDFNGMPVAELVGELRADWATLKPVMRELVAAERVGILFADSDLNPHILRHGFESVDTQLSKLAATQVVADVCVYPKPDVLRQVVDPDEYAGRPYVLALALGAPQLEYRIFDLSVLETYRNDPRYMYQTDDIGGSLSVHDKYFESDHMLDRDQVLLQSFGFAYDEHMRRAAAVFLCYLADLSPEHQQIWKSRELRGEFRLHPDYFRRTILGEWGERVSIFSAMLVELYVINQMSTAMGRPPLFRRDYGEHAEGGPVHFCFLVRPTMEELNSFILLLDKLLSDNINKAFFLGEVTDEAEEQRADGKVVVRPKGTLTMLDEWLRAKMRLKDWKAWEQAIGTVREVRKLRQKPAHAVDENAFDQRYFAQQRDLMLGAYEAIRTIRLVFANHPAARTVEVPDWLFEGLIWDI